MASSEPQEMTVELVPIQAPTADLIAFFTGEVEFTAAEADPQRVQAEILTQILSAETEDELWAELPTWSTKDNVGGMFLVEGGQIYPSKFTDQKTGRKGGFLSARCVNLDTGERGVLNTSAARIAGKLIWLAQHDALPCKVEIVKRGESAQGFDILDLRRIDD